jgi:hypothetical protein
MLLCSQLNITQPFKETYHLHLQASRVSDTLHAACFMPVSSLPHFGHKDGGDTFFQNIS